MSICTAIMAIPSLWDGVLSGTSNEAGTHRVLIWGSLVGEVLVAIGILLEIERPLNLRKVLSFAAVIVGVILGAAGTLLLLRFDEAISLAQQSKIVDLESQIAPRRLSADEIEALKMAVGPFTGRQISIWSYGLDIDAGRLATQIKSVLETAHASIIDRIGAMVSSTTPRIGVIITGPDDGLVAALLKALKPLSAVRGPLPGGFTTFGPAPTQTVPPAEIFVGIKPLSP